LRAAIASWVDIVALACFAARQVSRDEFRGARLGTCWCRRGSGYGCQGAGQRRRRGDREREQDTLLDADKPWLEAEDTEELIELEEATELDEAAELDEATLLEEAVTAKLATGVNEAASIVEVELERRLKEEEDPTSYGELVG
jgi:hypothetical protein